MDRYWQEATQVQTSRVFIRRAVWAQGQPERLYRTGDMVRVQPIGLVYSLGRKKVSSSCVKIQGFRIELEEITAILEGHEDVIRAVALVEESRQHRLCFHKLFQDRRIAIACPLSFSAHRLHGSAQDCYS